MEYYCYVSLPKDHTSPRRQSVSSDRHRDDHEPAEEGDMHS